MAKVGRLAGAILVHSGEDYFLVGNTKEPCDFAAEGFASPDEIDLPTRRYTKLVQQRVINVQAPVLVFELEGEALAAALSERLLIERNGSVSERLWRLLFDPSGEDDPPANGIVNARWLTEIPSELWAIVRDTILRCL
ncbi:MAG TPA: hypothetical protein VMF50_02840 [Candidatus Binataceae bacterium]|nr:hypothetical protein [Candidatus Binataceae bacterium]